MGNLTLYILFIILGAVALVYWVFDLVCAVIVLLISFIPFIYSQKDRKRLRFYAFNLALSGDQNTATKALGQDPDGSISGMLGEAHVAKDNGVPVNDFWMEFGRFVDKIFYNDLWKIEKNHIRNSIEKNEENRTRVFIPFQNKEGN